MDCPSQYRRVPAESSCHPLGTIYYTVSTLTEGYSVNLVAPKLTEHISVAATSWLFRDWLSWAKHLVDWQAPRLPRSWLAGTLFQGHDGMPFCQSGLSTLVIEVAIKQIGRLKLDSRI